MTMTLKDYFSLSMKGLMAKPGMVVFTFLAIVVSKWVYYSALNSMGDSVTNEELGNVLIVRLISDFITITVGFLLLFSRRFLTTISGGRRQSYPAVGEPVDR